MHTQLPKLFFFFDKNLHSSFFFSGEVLFSLLPFKTASQQSSVFFLLLHARKNVELEHVQHFFLKVCSAFDAHSIVGWVFLLLLELYVTFTVLSVVHY